MIVKTWIVCYGLERVALRYSGGGHQSLTSPDLFVKTCFFGLVCYVLGHDSGSVWQDLGTDYKK